MPVFSRSIAVAATLITLAGCANLPSDRGYAETRALIDAQRPLPVEWSPLQAEEPPEVPSTPIGVEDAVRLAFFHNPRIRETYARLGIGRADLEEARRLANPTFGYARLSPQGGDGSQITRSLSFGLSDLLLLPARKRLATGELDRLQKAVAGEVLALATEVEVAWYAAVGAQQIAAMRDLIAQAAGHSAELAQRFFDAGNINRLQLEQERAAATTARIDALGAGAEALRARSALGGLIGQSSNAAWATQTQLSAPHPVTFSADALIPLALESRLDLAATRQAVAVQEDMLGVIRRWRWFGSIEVGYEREREGDGSIIRGPSLALGLPLFNQGQGAVARAQAELLRTRAELDGQVLAVHSEARLGIEQLAVAATIAERYRAELVPQREAIVARTQERVNFMLVGIFELLVAKQQEYDAYQAYLEAVRDYWIARAELRGAVGGRLPDDDVETQPSIGVESVLPQSGPAMDRDHSGMDHSGMDHSGMDHSGMDSNEMEGRELDHSEMDGSGVDGSGHGDAASDPHAGHRMTAPTPSADPHAGHGAPSPATTPDPHAGHRMPAPTTPPPSEDTKDKPSNDRQHDHGDTP